MKKQLRNSRTRFDPLLKIRVTRWLENAPRGRKTEVAEMLGVSERTLRNWKTQADSKKLIGRPKKEIELVDLISIGREWKKQGFKGSRPVIAALPWIRVRLIREVVSKLKAKRKERVDSRIKINRISITTEKAGTIHTLDATDLGHRNMLLVGKDRASRFVRATQVLNRCDENETIRYLQTLKAEDQLPLVLATDNGLQFCSKKVAILLEEEQVIHLRSEPHTPQHNGACEIAIRELKETLVETRDLDRSLRALNYSLKRRQLNYKTAAEVDDIMKLKYTEHDRKKFYACTKELISRRIFGLKSAREIRKAEREAILETLERFKLVKLTRGDQSLNMQRENIT